MTGLSGSGKSSLAFDTIYADGQRRYVESLSSYARMFLGQMEKPDVDSIEGLSPAISIDQKTTSKNPRSTCRNSYRNIRLPATSLRAYRRSALSGMRQGDIDSRASTRWLTLIMALPRGNETTASRAHCKRKKGTSTSRNLKMRERAAMSASVSTISCTT